MKQPNKKALINASGDAPALSQDALNRLQPATHILPAPLQEKLGMRRRGLQKTPLKTRVTIRLSPEVVDYFRASGTGWQGRMDNALKDWLSEHSLPEQPR